MHCREDDDLPAPLTRRSRAAPLDPGPRLTFLKT
jgi:hypothetical protein